jgi:hypothetical protein
MRRVKWYKQAKLAAVVRFFCFHDLNQFFFTYPNEIQKFYNESEMHTHRRTAKCMIHHDIERIWNNLAKIKLTRTVRKIRFSLSLSYIAMLIFYLLLCCFCVVCELINRHHHHRHHLLLNLFLAKQKKTHTHKFIFNMHTGKKIHTYE